MERSNQSHVYFFRTDLNTEGNYGCEVSTEAPSFRTVKAEKQLRVYVLPETNPDIKGIQSRYRIGDDINVTCTSGFSKPPASLQWFINDIEAPKNFLTHYPLRRRSDGLQSSTLQLTLVADPSHLLYGTMTLQCTASISQIYSESSDEVAFGDSPTGPSPQYGVHVVPGEEGPRITGSLPHYGIDDMVDVNCTSAKSAQPAELKWYINDQEVRQEHIIHHRPIEYSDGQISSKIGLRFRTQEGFFRTELRLRCSSTLWKVITMSTMKTVAGASHQSSGLHASETRRSGIVPNGGGSRALSRWLLWFVMILL